MTRRSLLSTALSAPFLRAATSLKAGAATANISPPLGASLAGGMTDRKCTEVHDELLVRCAALESGSTRTLLMTVDSCMVPRTVLDPVRARIARENSIAPEHILISSTHTHSAPPAMHLFQSKPDPAYIEMLSMRIGDAARMAFLRLRPARVGFALGEEGTLAFNRRYFMRAGAIPADPFGRKTDQVLMNPPILSKDVIKPAGPVNPDHTVLSAVGDDGRIIFVYGSFSLHYAGYNPGEHASADYFGAWARKIEQECGGDTVAILANGCSGNVNAVDITRPSRASRDYSFIDRTAGILAVETLRLLRNVRYSPEAKLSAAWENIELGTRRPSKEQYEEAKAKVGEQPRDDYKDRALIYAREAIYLAKYPATIQVPVQGLRIGDTGIGTFPGETFVELGQQIKARKIQPNTVTVSIANDACGYIPTVEAFDLGGYETWRAKSSFVEREAARKLEEGVARVLGKAGV